jgi:hypothetical protein
VVASKVTSLEASIGRLFAHGEDRESRCATHLQRTAELERRLQQIEQRIDP